MAKKEKGSIGFESLLLQASQRQFKPVYLLQGEEPWFIDKAEEALLTAGLEPHEHDFNLTVLYGKDASFDEIINTAKRFPMMAERQIVIVREAQDLDCWRREDRRDRFEQYLKDPQATTVLILCHKYKSVASTLKVYKALVSVGEVFVSNKLDAEGCEAWVRKLAEQSKLKLSNEVVANLGEYLGEDLGKLEHAIDKLRFMCGDEVVTPDDVERYIGISKDYNVIELQQAIAEKDHLKAQRIVQYFAANTREHNINMVVAFLFNFWSKLLVYHRLSDKSNQSLGSHLKMPWSAFGAIRTAGANYREVNVIQNIALLRSFDRMLKGRVNTSMTEGEQYRQLIQQMMN